MSPTKNVKAVGTKREVYEGHAHHTAGGLTKGDLMQTKANKIVSKKQHALGVARMKALQRQGLWKTAPPFTKKK